MIAGLGPWGSRRSVDLANQVHARAWGELAMKGKICAAACGLLGTVLVVAAPSAVRAEDDDVPFDQKIIKNVLGTIGLSGGADINYRERSPLVLPPKIDLPPPQKD